MAKYLFINESKLKRNIKMSLVNKNCSIKVGIYFAANRIIARQNEYI